MPSMRFIITLMPLTQLSQNSFENLSRAEGVQQGPYNNQKPSAHLICLLSHSELARPIARDDY
jgi:hypothetical protein